MKRRRRWRLILVFYVLFIYSNSMKPAAISSRESGGLLLLLQQMFLKSGISAGMLTEHLIRKSAHFAEYTLLGLLLYKNVQLCPWRDETRRFAVIAAGFFLPFVDETIQLFAEGRSGQISDVWLDMSGVCAGILISICVEVVVRRGRRKGRGEKRDKL